MAGPTAVTGSFAGRFAFVRIGTGAQPLVVLPGLALIDGPPRGLTLTAYARGFARLARDHTLHVVHRPTGLAPGASTADIAGEYATVLDTELGRYRLMGLSTGGLIAQHLALAHPAAVQRLALVVSGARLAPEGRALCERWLDLAGKQRWRELHGDMAASAVDGPLARWLARTLFPLSARPPTPVESADFATTTSAALAHDTTAQLPELRVPTLVIGGARDPFFPADALAATAAAIPDARLHVFPTNGHGVPKQRARAMQEIVAGFLTG